MLEEEAALGWCGAAALTQRLRKDECKSLTLTDVFRWCWAPLCLDHVSSSQLLRCAVARIRFELIATSAAKAADADDGRLSGSSSSSLASAATPENVSASLGALAAARVLFFADYIVFLCWSDESAGTSLGRGYTSGYLPLGERFCAVRALTGTSGTLADAATELKAEDLSHGLCIANLATSSNNEAGESAPSHAHAPPAHGSIPRMRPAAWLQIYFGGAEEQGEWIAALQRKRRSSSTIAAAAVPASSTSS